MRDRIKKVPVCKYTTQHFKPWLRFFLGRKEIDNALRETYQKLQGPPLAHGTEMRDVLDSPVFQNLFRDKPGPHSLIFGIYIEWFNVFKLKIAGASVAHISFREKGIVRNHFSVLYQPPAASEI